MTYQICSGCGLIIIFKFDQYHECLGNNGEPIKNINPEVCEEQLERLSHEAE